MLHFGFFDKFNFVWFLLAFSVGVVVCYRDSLPTFWSSLPRFGRWLVIVVMLVGFGFMTHLIVPLFIGLTKEFWFAGKKIYELYEVTRSSRVN
jgi:hypothetical protein